MEPPLTDTQGIKTRFAPSPTGNLHLGNVRTALYSALYAWQQNGQFLLRFEDTDQERSRPEFVQSIMSDLRWLGLDWDEGPGCGESCQEDYHQSGRAEIYQHYFDQLIEKELAYPCFCSNEQLAAIRRSQLASGQPPRYPGTCSRLSAEEVEAKRAKGIAPTLRFRVPKDEVIHFEDLLKGEQHYHCRDIGDFVIRRADGSAAFFFSNVIDDSLMGVTDVIRGEDHITNTPRQIMLLQALGLRIPRYAHTPMLLGDDGGLLSKRHGSFSVQELRGQGYLPEAVVNYLGRIGQAVDVEECLPARDLAQHFFLQKMSHSPARFDSSQMDFWQKKAVTRLDTTKALDWSRTRSMVPEAQQQQFVRLILPNILFGEDMKKWAEILYQPLEEISDAAQQVLQETDPEFFAAAVQSLDEVGEELSRFAAVLGERSGRKGRALFMPLRAALSGRLDGPSIPDLLALLGVEEAKKRMQNDRILSCPNHRK